MKNLLPSLVLLAGIFCSPPLLADDFIDGQHFYAMKEFEQAYISYKKAAEQNHPKAQYRLGSLYDKGHGTERDLKKAQYWYQKSAGQGYPLAIDELKKNRTGLN